MTTYHEYAESNGLAHETTLDTFTEGTTEHRLVYLPAGDYPAGSRLRRESAPRWGILWTLRDGTNGGQTYRDENVARAEWDAKRERLRALDSALVGELCWTCNKFVAVGEPCDCEK